MGARAFDEYPSLEDLSGEELTRRIKAARLSKIDKYIAIARLVWRTPYADIAAAVNLHRTTVARRLHDIISRI